MNNDLISRTELKKCAIPCEIHNGALTDLCVPLYQIDNAPPVEAIPKELHEKIMDKTVSELLECQSNLRPQGEWIDYSDEGYVECPFCGSATNCEDNKDELHYCWNCGARMGEVVKKNDGEDKT